MPIHAPPLGNCDAKRPMLAMRRGAGGGSECPRTASWSMPTAAAQYEVGAIDLAVVAHILDNESGDGVHNDIRVEKY